MQGDLQMQEHAQVGQGMLLRGEARYPSTKWEFPFVWSVSEKAWVLLHNLDGLHFPLSSSALIVALVVISSRRNSSSCSGDIGYELLVIEMIFLSHHSE